ncbi:MAG TPA: nuclear transport factor 2 family protein, partial [Candidatus Limnocylindrales bacterium]
MVASQETIAAVRGVLDRFAAAYAAKDIARVLGCFAVGDHGVLIGTGADEWRVGEAEVRAQTERDFAQGDALAISYRDIHIDGREKVAWFAARAAIRASVSGEPFGADVRLSGVLTREGDGWKIVQSHLSFPAAGQEPG